MFQATSRAETCLLVYAYFSDHSGLGKYPVPGLGKTDVASAVYLILMSASWTLLTAQPRVAIVTGRVIVTRILSNSYVTLTIPLLYSKGCWNMPQKYCWMENMPVSVIEMILATLANAQVIENAQNCVESDKIVVNCNPEFNVK